MFRSERDASSSKTRRVSCFGRSRLLSWRDAPKSVTDMDQFGQRPCAHLFHYMSAVCLYGQFADAELGSDLFVEQAGDNHTKNFPLPGAQRVKGLPKFCYFRPLLASGAVAGDRSLNRLQQILATERFGQKLHRACLHGLYRHGNVAMAGDEDDGNVDVRFAQLALKIQSAEVRKPNIQNQAAWRIRPCTAKKVQGRSECQHSKPHRPDEASDSTTD